MHGAVFAIAVAFTTLMAYLTAVDFVRYGVTAIGVLGILIVVLFTIGIVGALRHPPRQ